MEYHYSGTEGCDVEIEKKLKSLTDDRQRMIKRVIEPPFSVPYFSTFDHLNCTRPFDVAVRVFRLKILMLGKLVIKKTLHILLPFAVKADSSLQALKHKEKNDNIFIGASSVPIRFQEQKNWVYLSFKLPTKTFKTWQDMHFNKVTTDSFYFACRFNFWHYFDIVF